MSDTFGNSGQQPSVPPQFPPSAAQGPQVGQANDVQEVARAILMDPELSPHVMSERFWRLRQQHLRETYGIDIE